MDIAMAEKSSLSQEKNDASANARPFTPANDTDSLDEYLLRESSELSFGYYARFSMAKDFLEFKSRITEEINHLGFSDYSFVKVLNKNQSDSQQLGTFSKQFLDSYFENGLYEQDIIIDYAENSQTPICRSLLDEYIERAPFVNDMTKGMGDIKKLNKSFGYYDFYNIPMKAKNDSGSVMLSVTDRGCNPVDFRSKVNACESTLKLLCEAIDYVVVKKFSNLFLSREEEKNKEEIVINQKPLLVLDTLANNDLNIAQVADKLFISVVTANKHLETARKALGARTNYAAIKKAVLYGLIEFQE